MVNYELTQAKSILSKRMNGDSWFHSNHSMNVYRGCQFACAYCDGMSEYYHVDNYLTNIRVKENAPNLLRKELKRMGYIDKTRSILDFTESNRSEQRKPIIGLSGGISDSYQQAEKEYKITQKLLEVLLEYQLPVFILTKSNLVLRDLDLIKEINNVAHASVNFSIAFSDEKTKDLIEPYSSSIAERLDALKRLRHEGIHGGVMGLPIVPYIGDSLESLETLVKSVKNTDAEYIILGGMTLKPGRQKNHFYRVIRRHFPDKLTSIKLLYSDDNKYGIPKNDALIDPMILSPGICEKYGIRWTSLRHGCKDEIPENTKVLATLLEHLFVSNMVLREPKHKNSDLHNLAIKIEQGMHNIRDVIEGTKLQKKYELSANQVHEIESILQTGSSPRLTLAKKRAYKESILAIESLS